MSEVPEIPPPNTRTVKDALEALEFSRCLDDDAVVTDAVVLLRIARLDGGKTLLYDRSQGTDDVVMYGMLTATTAILNSCWQAADDYDT